MKAALVVSIVRTVHERPDQGSSSTPNWRVLGSMFGGAIGGGVMAASYEPIAQGWLAPVAVGILVAAVLRLSIRAAAATGYIFGVVYLAAMSYWLAPSIGVPGWLALSIIEAAWYAALAAGIRWTQHLPGAAAWAAGLWMTAELARGAWPFGGFPWGRLAFAVIDTPWSALLPYLGVTGTGLVLAALGAVGARALLQPSLVRTAGLVALAAASLMPTVAPYGAEAAGTVAVGVVQGDVPGRGNDVVAHHREVTANHVRATLGLAADLDSGDALRPDLVVWPENSTAVDPFQDEEAGDGIETAVRALDAPLLIGAVVNDGPGGAPRNQGVLWEPDGPTDQRYIKQHLVPFGEYIPFRRVFGSLSARLRAINRDMVPGTATGPLRLGELSVADALCFDVAYGVLAEQVRQGASVMVVQTSNATFTGTAQQAQQFAITRVRALELGRAVAVASTNGLSGFISADGEVLHQLPRRETVTLVESLPLRTDLTPAAQLGNVLEVLIFGLAIMGVAVAYRQARAGDRR